MKHNIGLYTPPLPKTESYRETIDLAAEFGVSTVECLSCFEFETPDPEIARSLRDYADSKNVKFSCLSVHCNLAGENAAAAIARVKAYADVAAILGSPYLHHTIVCEDRDPEKVLPYREKYFEQGVRAVREIYDHAAAKGIRTIYENQGYLFNGVEGFGRFLKEVERDVGVIADFGNSVQMGETIMDFVKAFAPRICHAHLKDVILTDDDPTGTGLKTLDGRYKHEVRLGTGEVPFGEAVAVLREVGYQGYYTVEARTATNDPAELGELLRRADVLVNT